MTETDIPGRWIAGRRPAIHQSFGFLDGFAARCGRAPDAVAVADGRRQLTYGGLDRRSSRLARALRLRGVGPETPVGVCLERGGRGANAGSGLELTVAALAIFKAGGVYVPLDPAYPAPRLASMIAGAGVELVLTHGESPALPPENELDLRALDRGAGAGVQIEPPRPLAVAPPAAAYVVYTSGSTGRPRGVVVSHRALGWYSAAAARHYALAPGDRLLQLASISFDISIGEIFPVLVAGATLVFPPGAEPAADVFARCRERAVTVLFPPTALWHELASLAAADPRAVPATLRLVSFGGERVAANRIEAWRRSVGRRIRLVNGYGPTETTVEATLCDLTGTSGGARLIGRPAAGVRVYVLDRRGRPVAAGVDGELAITGPGLARGYHAAAADTARRFVPDPAAGRPGERMYLTGDRVRRRPDGELEIHGRLDRQVKIRGFRVEPAEVEAVLAEHPMVGDAAVVAWRPEGRQAGGYRLAAFAVVEARDTRAARPAARAGVDRGTGILGVGGSRRPSAGALEPAASLRDFLLRRLPDYMVPASVELLEALPLSPNGKVDRRALERRCLDGPPAPAPRRRPYVAPRGAAETALARIWRRVLRVDRVGADDDFFELGGDSILSIQIATRALGEGLRFSPHAVFEHPTVARLAAVATVPERRAMDRGPVVGSAPLTPVQRWFFDDAEMSEPDHFNQSMLLEIRRRLEPSVLERAAHQLLARHDVLRSRFEPAPAGWRQVFIAPPRQGSPPPVARIDLSRLDGGAAARALSRAAAAVQASLDIERGPLLRLVVFDDVRAAGERPRAGRLLIVVHHLVMDAVSWSILLGDLEHACRLGRRRPLEAPARTTSYKAWAELQVDYARSAELRREAAYWAALPGAERPLPRDFAAGDNRVASAAVVSVALEAQATRLLLHQVPAAYRTRIDDVLLTALARTLAPWAGAQRVDLESHGREEISTAVDLSRTIGWFTSTFPVFLGLEAAAAGSDDRALGEALVAVKERLRAVPRGGIGYGILRYLGEGAELGAAAEVSFNYLGQLDALLADSRLFAPAPEPRGAERGRQGTRPYVIEVDGGVVSGRLWINWHFSRGLHRRATVERLAAAYKRELVALIAHCTRPGAGRVTPSDFPLARLNGDRLAELAGRDVEDLYPLSPMQQGMLFHGLYAPGSAVYFEQSSWSIAGELDAGALRRSWRRLAARHPILRTSFVWRELERPLQLVHRTVEVPFAVEDWRRIPAAEQPERLESLLRADRRRPFDLTQAPLMRLFLIRLDAGSWRLVWSIHHLLLDGWSIAALFDELFEIYRALAAGGEPELPRRRPFRDFIAWLEARDRSGDEAFWRRALAGFRAPTPIAGVEAGMPDHQEVVDLRRVVSAARTARLTAFARARRLTLGNLLRGAWGLVLARASGERDVVFGATVSGRPALAGADSIVGLLINTLPVRVRLEPGRRVLPWLEELQAAGLELQRHEHTPLVDIQSWSEMPPHLPLFDSLLVVENYPTGVALEAEQRRAGLAIGGFTGYSQTNYPLTLGVLPGDELTLEATVDPRRVEPTVARRLLGHLEAALIGMLEQPGRRLDALEVLSAAERHQLRVEWQRPAGRRRCWRAGRKLSSVHRRFEAQAARAPDAVALVVPPDRVLTYGALNRRANRLARELRHLGVGPESRVGLAIERSAELVVAILAVLKAGGAYLPLDPSHPRGRLRGMLERAGAGLLLTRGPAAARAAARAVAGATVLGRAVDVDRLNTAARRHGSHDLAGGIARCGLAYVLHTSGSTGVPKGVAVSHGALLDTLDAWEQAYRLRAVARVHLQVADFTFDVASGDLLRALGTGAALVLCPRQLLLEPPALAALMRRQRVDCLELVPAVAGLLARQLESEGAALEYARLIAVGSDVWHFADLRRLAGVAGPRARVVSSYGVTEAAIDSTFFDAGAGGRGAARGEAGATVPIGRPFADVAARVVDRRLSACGIGVAGELLIGGALARGYAGDPAATAERFVPDPFPGAGTDARPGARLYRTGDRARHLSGGKLELLGRVDHQVKIRGVRVEPGEVEAALRRHPALAEAVAVAFDDGAGPRVLAAFVVAAAGAEAPPPGQLRDFLATRLPPPMIPSVFVARAALPLNGNGKVDRAALGRMAPDASAAIQEIPEAIAFEPPATATERALAEIWSSILGAGRVGRRDDFFDLGGHSLRAVSLIAEIERRFGVRLPLVTLFLQPILADQAREVEASESAAA